MEENEMRLFSRKYTKRKRFTQDASLVPCTLMNSESLKPDGCDDMDCYMRKSDLSKDSYDMVLVEHGQRQENSVENGVHFEKQGSETGLISLEPTASKLVEYDSSTSNSENLENEEACQTSDVADGENSKLGTDCYNTFVEANVEYGGYDMAYEEYLKSFGEDFDISKELFDFGYISQHNEEEIGLVDVHLTVNASYRAENVPFVCLNSKLDGKSVLGYPVEIEELTDSDEEKESILDGLVWKTSRRTPVCYGKNSVYSVSEYFKSDGESNNGLVAKDEKRHMYMTIPIQFRKGRTQPNACCVPVDRIFCKIEAGVGQEQSQNTC